MNYYMGTLLATWIVGPLSDEYDVTINTWYLKAIFLIAVPFAGRHWHTPFYPYPPNPHSLLQDK